MPKRTNVDDYFARLAPHERQHLEALRALSHAVDPTAREELKWNLPVYVRGRNTNLWMLQNYKHHCSLRFTPEFFGPHRATVIAAGFDAGEGFVKLLYAQVLPTELLRGLMEERVRDFEADARAA
jgi:uncharacterized protein YdhG (YjbR/CyaY superfamily)